MNQIGVNAWVWTSPPTDGWLTREAPRIKDLGFDAIELPVESPGDWDPEKTAELLDRLGLSATVCAAMSPGRDLLAEDSGVVGERGHTCATAWTRSVPWAAMLSEARSTLRWARRGGWSLESGGGSYAGWWRSYVH